MVFVFGSVSVIDYIYRFVDVEPELHPWDEADLIVVNKLSNLLLDLVCQYFIEDFHINVHQGYSSEIFVVVVVVSLPSFGMRMMLAS